MQFTSNVPHVRRFLCADALIDTLRRRFQGVPDSRDPNSVTYSMADTLMVAFAMFPLKDPSLLVLQERFEGP